MELMSGNEFALTIGEVEEVDVPTVLTLEQMLTNAVDLVEAGEHFWVISLVYHLADPELALDSMELSSENLIGPSRIQCLFCNEPHREGLGGTPCPSNPPG